MGIVVLEQEDIPGFYLFADAGDNVLRICFHILGVYREADGNKPRLPQRLAGALVAGVIGYADEAGLDA